jgi:hypothetical protein
MGRLVLAFSERSSHLELAELPGGGLEDEVGQIARGVVEGSVVVGVGEDRLQVVELFFFVDEGEESTFKEGGEHACTVDQFKWFEGTTL